jgi:hypothetical protein
MKGISLIVEGDEDVRFLQDFISFHFLKEFDKSYFIIIGGNSSAIHQSRTKIQISTDSGNQNIVIFDGDDDDCPSTLSKINSKAQEFLLKFDKVFLLPDNKAQGNLESLLMSSVTKRNEKLFNCIDEYSVCRAALNLKKPRIIDEKEKLRIYYGSFESSGKVKGTERKYRNADIWDLNSSALNPLKEFLEKVLS